MSVRREICRTDGCDTVVTREVSDAPGRIAAMTRSIPLYCDECVARQDAEARERESIEAGERALTARRERLKKSGLPAKYHGRELADLDHAEPVLAELREWVDAGTGLLLTGEIGRGKTTLAGAACWARLEHGPVSWTSAPLLFARLGSGLGSEQRDSALGVLSGKRALVLDDIDKVRPTEYGAEQVFLAIDQRVEHAAPLLVTSNLAPSQLAEKWPEPYGPAIASRLVGYCRVVRVEGVDRRLAGVGS